MPREIPLFVKNNYITHCFSDDSINSVSFILEQCGCKSNINYITTDGKSKTIDLNYDSTLNTHLLSQYDINAMFVECDPVFFQNRDKFEYTEKKIREDYLNSLKSEICSKFNQSESKNIHEMISYSSLILKIPVNNLIDKQLLNTIWSTLDLNTDVVMNGLSKNEPVKIVAMKKIIRHGKKEHHKEMKIPKKEYCQSNIEALKTLFSKDELYKCFVPDKNKKEITHLYIYTDTNFVLILEESKQEIYLLVKNMKHIPLKRSFPSNNETNIWSSFVDVNILNILKHYISFDTNVPTDLKHAIINYDSFISVSDISLMLENQTWMKYFFCWPNTSEANYIHYRPHYQTKEIDINTDISAKIQQVDKKNCLRFVINVPENNTFSTLVDVIQLIYFLLDPEKLQHSSVGKLNYKEFDPYLFKDNIRKGGYTRQCTDYWDRKMVDANGDRIKRKKVPRLLVSKGDNDDYDSIPIEHKKYKLYYRGNYYAAIDDYIDNSKVIDEYNNNLGKGKKNELYLNTVVLFPIQDKYQKDNEELFYPECVRAKSGMPMPKHQYILKKLLDEGKIDIVDGNADIIKSKLKANQDLQRADLVYYISRIGTKLKGFSTFGTLPLVVNKFLCMANNLANSDYLSTFIRKIAINANYGFLDACLDAVDDKYRRASMEEKRICLDNYKHQILEWINNNKANFDWWISFGKLKTHFDSLTLLKHTYSLDILGMFFNMNIFVLELKNEYCLQRLNRTVQYNREIPSLFILYWEDKGYEIIFKSNDDDSGKEIKKQQFLFKHSDSNIGVIDNIQDDISSEHEIGNICVSDESNLLEYLCDVFDEHSLDAANLKYSCEVIDKIDKTFKQKVTAQFVDNENKTVGLITSDGWMCPIPESPPIPHMMTQKNISKCSPQFTVGKLSLLSRIYPEFTIVKQVVNNNNIVIAFLLNNGTISPIEESQFFRIDKPTINQKLIPYVEGITHFTTENVNKYDDARITYMNTLKKKKQYFEIMLTEIHKVVTDKSSHNYEKDWSEIFDLSPSTSSSASLSKLFNLLMVVTKKILIQQPNDLMKFANRPNEQITQNMMKRLIFQAFHYLKNHPNFIYSSVEIHMKKLNSSEHHDFMIIDNNSIKSGNTFESFFVSDLH